MKYTLKVISSRLGDTEEHISDLKNRIMEIRKAKRKTNLNNEFKIKWANIHIIGVPEEREKGSKINVMKLQLKVSKPKSHIQISLSADFFCKSFAVQKRVAQYIQHAERENSTN